MKEIGNIIRISENIPLMTSPKANKLKYNGITPFGNQTFLGTALDTPSLD